MLSTYATAAKAHATRNIPMGLRKQLVVLFLFAFWSAMPSASAAEDGPLNVRNRFPLYLMFLSPPPVSARLPDEGVLNASFSVDYSSVYVDRSSSRWGILMDMEIAVAQFAIAYGLSKRAAFRLEIPLVHMTGGFLDGFLESYHDTLGVSNYGRKNRPKNSFAYFLQKDGAVWLEGDAGGLQLADATLTAQWSLIPASADSHGSASLLAALKAPSGRAKYGTGSGHWDAGIFLPMELGSGSWALFVMPGYIYHSDPDTRGADVSARPSITFLIGARYAYNDHLMLLGHLNYFSSPIEKTGIGMLDDGGVELALGFRYIWNPAWRIEFAFCEDLFTRAAPDFTLHLGITRSFTGWGK
jgi:hypothetical protein